MNPLEPRTGLTALDVFSGAGGLAAGWLAATRQYGGSLLGAVDSDASLAPVYETNFPGTVFLQHKFATVEADDALQISRALSLRPGQVDTLLAGPPCQSVSSAGKRSAAHPDNRLALRVAEIASNLRPTVVIIENVPEFGWAEGGRLLGRLRVQLRDAGYRTQVGILNSSAFGVPQIRQRCFVVAVLSERFRNGPESLLPSATTATIVSARTALPIRDSGLPRPPTVMDALGDLPPLRAGEGTEEADYAGPPQSDYAAMMRARSKRLFNHVSVKHSDATVAALAELRPGETPQLFDSHRLKRRPYFRSAYARLVGDGLAPTITTQTQNPGSGRFTHYAQDRVLTVREVARLQSFPDEFVFLGDGSAQRRHVGNAVPPKLAEAISTHLLPYLLG